jgi:hypothetical protein
MSKRRILDSAQGEMGWRRTLLPLEKEFLDSSDFRLQEPKKNSAVTTFN